MNWTKANNYKQLAFNKQSKWKVREGLTCKNCALCGHSGKRNNGPMRFTNNDKK